MRWHWLIRSYRFQVYISVIYDLYIALCAHPPKSFLKRKKTLKWSQVSPQLPLLPSWHSGVIPPVYASGFYLWARCLSSVKATEKQGHFFVCKGSGILFQWALLKESTKKKHQSTKRCLGKRSKMTSAEHWKYPIVILNLRQIWESGCQNRM